MHRFSGQAVTAHQVELQAIEAQHCAKVLRHQPGDEIIVIDGKGTQYLARLVSVHQKRCLADILETKQCSSRADWRLSVAIAPPKNNTRLEWFLEKATEIGIDRIIPIQCQHSERIRLRPDRLEKILLAATKQSQRFFIPELAPLTPLKDLLKDSSLPPVRYMAYCGDTERVVLSKNYSSGSDVIILIGPEGDFSPEEVALAREQAFSICSMGEARLRTETAALVACHTINLLNQ